MFSNPSDMTFIRHFQAKDKVVSGEGGIPGSDSL